MLISHVILPVTLWAYMLIFFGEKGTTTWVDIKRAEVNAGIHQQYSILKFKALIFMCLGKLTMDQYKDLKKATKVSDKASTDIRLLHYEAAMGTYREMMGYPERD